MSEHAGEQGQAASVAARRVSAERMARLAQRVAPADDAETGLWARLHADGTVEVTAYMHHDGINTNVTLAPPPALTEIFRALLEGAQEALTARAGHDVVATMVAGGGELGEEE